ncbi:MAG: exodeoxyribonuclease III [Candidatus Nanoarchaeia archaeon]|nr:exodeoxyribonuclease III [Candidatus Nanoarchaeia archaeon]
MSTKIHSWNVNGIRAVLKKDFLDYIKEENPDILCIQEIKAQEDTIPNEIKELGYYKDYSFAKKKGYSGVMILSKEKPISISKEIGIKEFDDEGRYILFEFKDFYMINCYFPNSQPELVRIDFKNKFNNDLLNKINELKKNKPVILTGDFNVAHEEIDLKNPKTNTMNPGFYIDERNWFTKLLENDFVDTFRYFNKEPDNYTWWSYRFSAREKNIGWRIDYFVVSKDIIKKVKESNILKDYYGSDHCPIELIIDFND